MMWLAYASAWVSMAVTVSIGIIITEKWWLLFFMLIPLLVRAEGGR